MRIDFRLGNYLASWNRRETFFLPPEQFLTANFSIFHRAVRFILSKHKYTVEVRATHLKSGWKLVPSRKTLRAAEKISFNSFLRWWMFVHLSWRRGKGEGWEERKEANQWKSTLPSERLFLFCSRFLKRVDLTQELFMQIIFPWLCVERAKVSRSTSCYLMNSLNGLHGEHCAWEALHAFLFSDNGLLLLALDFDNWKLYVFWVSTMT